mgnify:CR=1 FL=1
MGGFRSFFIESKLFQLVIEEGGNFFSLKILERGKYYMQSVFMGKSAALWTMRNLEHTVSGVSPKQFFTFREGDIAYTMQRGSNSYGQYLSVTELKVGGLRRTIIIPAGKLQQGWRTFGIELRRLLEPSQYALGGSKFVPFRFKQTPKYQPVRSYVEAVKVPVQARLKQVQQPLRKEIVQAGTVMNSVEFPSDYSCTQVAVSGTQAGSCSQSAVGGGEGWKDGINGKNNFEEKIPEGNKCNISLKPNLNSNMFEFGKLRDKRKGRWLGKGLTVIVNEFGKRRVSWDGVKGVKQAGKWVSKTPHNISVGLGSAKQNAQALLGKKEPTLGLGLSSPLSFEAGESSTSGLKALEASYQNGLSMPSSGRSATKEVESSRTTPTVSEQHATPLWVSVAMNPSLAVTEVAGKGEEDITIPLAQPPTASTGPAVVAQASHVLTSPIKELGGSKLVPVGPSGMISEPATNPIVPAKASLDIPEASVVGEEDFVGLEGPGNFVFEGAQLAGPTIKDLVGDLD